MFKIYLFTVDMDTSIEVAEVSNLNEAVSLASSLYLMSKKPVRVFDSKSKTDIVSYYNV